MGAVFWLLGVAAFLAAAVLIISYVCFYMAFFVKRKKGEENNDVLDLPKGKVYDVYHDEMARLARETRATPYKEFSITSFDGLKLYGRFYEYKPGAPIELMFHGYRGSAERDLCGGMQRCRALRRSALIVSQRCSGKSDGNVITFGIREHRDCLSWIDFVINHFGKDVKIFLGGISMGASTVLMAAGKPLPKNVIGVLADCGFSSAKEIICEVIKNMGLPPKLAYPFVKLGAKIYGHFDLEETPACEAVKHATVPIIFFHGEDDRFVPCYMSKINFDACASKKCLVTMKDAAHGLCYLVEPERYVKSIKEFFEN